LATYLAHPEVRAKTMLVETPYVDRHYLQEYVGFYATKLSPPPRDTTRIHFWRHSFDDPQWKATLRRAATDGLGVVETELREKYLGYVVVRPIGACPIGRTVLAPYTSPARCYGPAATSHQVHLQGLTLEVPALPFQQQDQGLGACATTALWSSIARATRADGGRAATPLDVARAAVDGHVVASPNGLDLDAMKRAFLRLGYVPHVFEPKDEHHIFLLALKAYVRSGMAVVLRLRDEQTSEVHAVAIAGFRDLDDAGSPPDLLTPVRTGHLRSRGVSRFYVHDDRLGPYARFVLHPASAKEAKAAKKNGWAPPLRLKFDPARGGFETYAHPLRVESALVPLYPKVRTTAEDLITYAGEYLPVVLAATAPADREALRWEPYITLGGTYLATIGDVLRDPDRATTLRSTCHLSRYVGVARFFVGDAWLCDLVMDTTDVKRSLGESAPLLAAVTCDAGMAATFRRVIEPMGPDASHCIV
jgi:hypothetical protein